MKKFLFLLIVAGLIALAFVPEGREMYRQAGDFKQPEVSVQLDRSTVGNRIVVPFTVSDWNPVEAKYYFNDDEKNAKPLDATQSPLIIEPDKLESGKHTLHLVFTDKSYWRNSTTIETPLELDLRPPSISLLSPQRIWESRQGDTLLVFVRSDKPLVSAELDVVTGPDRQQRLQGAFFEAAPQVYCLLRPIDIETPPGEYTDELYFYDSVGNEGLVTQRVRVLSKGLRDGEVTLTPGILKKLGVESLEEQEQMRKENNARVNEVTSKISEERHFEGPFIRPAQGTWTSPYGQRRLYNGKVWHRHLGMDLADVQGAEVYASNHAVVVLAESLGIYGECVILDHGRGIYTLYGHNSKLTVKPGQKVKKRDVIAIQGETGLAGGVHLHLSFIVGGVYVAPDIFIQKFDRFSKDLAAALGPDAEPVKPAGASSR
jgi:murein DD-endopeptidase MepM/ murein hydrolase activator NlpD